MARRSQRRADDEEGANRRALFDTRHFDDRWARVTPASTTPPLTRLQRARVAGVAALLALSMLAACAGDGAERGHASKSSSSTHERHVISTPHAPPVIGPYSQGVRAGDLVFLSGQVPLDPKTGGVVGVDVIAQTEQVLDNLAAVLAAAGCGFDDVVKTTIYVVDLNDFAAVNEIYARRFSGSFPARATVQVSGLPRGASVEIDAIARSR